MNVKNRSPNHSSDRSKYIIAAAVIIAIVIITALFVLKPFSEPRSVASYCKVYEQQNDKLASAQGDSYSVKVFTHSTSDPGNYADAFSALNNVAPKDIQPDVESLQKLFQSIKDDPSKGMSASLSGLSAEDNVTQWTKDRCN
jgi:hypothetical protein